MLPDNLNKIFIGVAWPYVNGDLHIGHYAGYLLPCDVSARYHRLRGRNVLMVSGSDCFGTPTTIQADKEKKSPQEIADVYGTKQRELIKLLDLSYDLYTKTDTENHKKVTQDIFIRLLERGYIFKGSSQQYYSEVEKRFLPDRYVEGVCPNCKNEGARSDQCENCGAVLEQGELINPLSKNTKTPVSLRETEHYFLDWESLQEEFLNSYVSSPKVIAWRNWVQQETLGWLKQGLKGRAITRDLDWGVELPIDKIPAEKRIKNIESKRIYVWFEAVIGYLSASIEWAQIHGKDWKDFWHSKNSFHYYFMGKDNLIFHTLFWPGQLHAYDEELHLPDFPAINQFLNLEGRKFSKSRGIIIDTDYIVKTYGNDPVRFYLTSILPEENDSNFSWMEFYDKVNGVLIGNLGNFINRVLTLSKGIDFSKFSEKDVDWGKVKDAFKKSYEALDECRFKDYLSYVLELSSYGNALMTQKEPWKLKESNKEEYEKVMFNLFFLVSSLNYLITPLLPETSKKLKKLLGLGEINSWPKLSNEDLDLNDILEDLKKSKIGEVKPLFVKLEKKDIEEELKKLNL